MWLNWELFFLYSCCCIVELNLWTLLLSITAVYTYLNVTDERVVMGSTREKMSGIMKVSAGVVSVLNSVGKERP